jgi:hypothetical protein
MPVAAPDPDLLALGIRQPWAELILRGIKTIEVRSQGTAQRGTIYVYASKQVSDLPAARAAVKSYDLDLDALPKGVVVGTVEIVDSAPCQPSDTVAACLPRNLLAGRYSWKLRNAQRLDKPLPVRFLPYGIWFYPFRRRGGRKRS